MKRIVLAAVIILGPVAMAEQLPLPPIPPEHPGLGETAPVPNVDVRGPLLAVSKSPTVDVRLFRNRPYETGMGFTPGSRYLTSEDRKPIQTPGLSISVPLQ